MGKKKSGRKANDDWEAELGETIPPAQPSADATDAEAPAASEKPASEKPAEPATPADDDLDGGGLMASVQAASNKKGKKNKKKNEVNWDDLEAEAAEITGETPGVPADASPAPTATEEKSNAQEPEKEAPAPEPQQQKAQPQPDAESEAPRVLSKKEKERLKKEREKAAKKAAADAKKSQAPAVPQADEQSTPPSAGKEGGEGEGDDDEEGAASSSKNKKKKKKGGAAEKPAPSGGKKPSGALAMLRAQMEARKKAEEEARLAEEAERKRIEEEERLEKEEEERKEAARQAKKEKERLKKEQLRKEGKLLTPAEKKKQKEAEARLKAMVAAGQISADVLERRKNPAAPGAEAEDTKPTEKKKRVVYDNKKKKKTPPTAEEIAAQEAAAAEATRKKAEEEAKAREAAAQKAREAQQESKKPAQTSAAQADEDDGLDDWDAESGDDNGEKLDDWDASSEEDEAQDKAPAKSAPFKKSEKSAASVSASAAPSNGKPSGKSNAKKSAPTGKAASAQPDSESDSEDDDSDSDSDDDDESSSDEELTTRQKMEQARKEEAHERRMKRHEEALQARSKDDLRSPICCILGHVDTGKTKLLDKIRQTNVQEGEAGGITQQIGATYFPVENIRAKTRVIDPKEEFEFKVPGLLVIDTPGHESFTNLRSRGTSLCNIAILVVDVMHGLEPQTLESIRLLRDSKTPFIVALNKIDRLYGWASTPNNGFRLSWDNQNRGTQSEFEDRLKAVKLALAEQGLNAELYFENKDTRKTVSLVPTSAHTGEGIPDLLQLLTHLTQTRMSGALMYLSELEATVLEVKVIEGLGTTIDVVLSNGILHEGDRVVVAGLNGQAIVTQVRALLTPQPLKEMRVKGSYVHHKQIKAAMGVKIAAPDLEQAVAGSRLLVVGPDDDEDELRDEVMGDLTSLLNSIDRSGRGVSVQASTLGSLEALLEFLKQSKIPVSSVNIGPVYKKDVMRTATMLEKAPEFAAMLCFDVEVDKDAARLAEELGIRVFQADIIYHLFDAFTAYNQEILAQRRAAAAPVAVWPCRLRILHTFANRSPLILGVDIIDGSLRVGTPLAVVKVDPTTKKKTTVDLGRVVSMQINKVDRQLVQKKDVGGGVAVRIENEHKVEVGKQITESDEVVSKISRSSIDSLKDLFWDTVSTEEKRLIKKLKGVLDVP